MSQQRDISKWRIWYPRGVFVVSLISIAFSLWLVTFGGARRVFYYPDVMAPVLGTGLMVIGAVAWWQFYKARFPVEWPIAITLLGAVLVASTVIMWVWNSPDHIRTPLALAAALLVLSWIFVSLPVYLVLHRRHVPLWMSLYVFWLPIVFIGLLTTVFFLIGPLEAVWALIIMSVIAGGFFWFGPGSTLRQEFPPSAHNSA